jgi:prepilin-type processing-associated H-X9-DG protein
MLGEMQRITTISNTLPFGPGEGPVRSKDGWAVGGPATTFSTGVAFNGASIAAGAPQMNNGYYMSPGSEHSKGANFGLADGSVTFLSESMDGNTFALLGSMADDVPVKMPPP